MAPLNQAAINKFAIPIAHHDASSPHSRRAATCVRGIQNKAAFVWIPRISRRTLGFRYFLKT